MVEASTSLQAKIPALYKYLLEELERATDGTHILAGHALLNSDFK